MEQFCRGESGIAEKRVSKSSLVNITMNKNFWLVQYQMARFGVDNTCTITQNDKTLFLAYYSFSMVLKTTMIIITSIENAFIKWSRLQL